MVVITGDSHGFGTGGKFHQHVAEHEGNSRLKNNNEGEVVRMGMRFRVKFTVR